MKYSILRVAAVSPELTVADCKKNADIIISLVKEADAKNVKLLVFPELSITGYTCGDLFLQHSLLDEAERQLERIADESAGSQVLFATGLPLVVDDAIYNCAAFIQNGKILALVPKTYIPNYSEFYERRYFTPAPSKSITSIKLSERFDEVSFGTDIIFCDKDDSSIKIACEICEDLWVPSSPSLKHCLAGATVIANLSASNEVVGKADYRRMLVSAHSAKTLSAYIYADASHDESSTDMIFSGHNLIALNGSIKAESKPFAPKNTLLIADLDMERIYQERLRTNSFTSSSRRTLNDSYENYEVIEIELGENDFCGNSEKVSIGFSSQNESKEKTSAKLIGGVPKHPFVPDESDALNERSLSVIEMQAEGLAKRLRHIHAQSAVIGLSGGLDSTLALLVTARAFDKCGIAREKITCVTMPCFGTTDRTYSNAVNLARETGASLKEVNIQKAVRQHFADIEQDENVHDVTYENSQARERTQILMDIANKTNGLVIGTGDLSELALGWCTYNGDHMSMYGVNASIPKTLVRHLVAWFSKEALSNGKEKLSAVLDDILDTPVSPELLPPEKGNISQKTESIVGPYELHDFFLYYMLRFGFSPRKIFFLAKEAFSEDYKAEVILSWLKVFYRRFFSQQFKRSCMPDGAKVGTVSLSPRGDWRMPSDASAALWNAEIEELEKEL